MHGPLFQEQIGDVGDADDQVVALALELQIAGGVDVAAGKGVGHAEDGGQLAHGHAALARQRHVFRVRRLRPAAAMVAGDVGRQHGLFPIEPENLRIGDQVVAVLVMAAIAHVAAHLVQQPRHVQQEPVPRAQAVVGEHLVEQPQGHVGHRLRMRQIDVIFLRDRRCRVDHARRQRPVLFPRDPVGKLQQQPVAHRHVRDDDLRGLRQAEQVLIDQQGRIDGLGLGKRNAEPLGQLLGGPMLAALDQLVELVRDRCGTGRANRSAGRSGGRRSGRRRRRR